MLACRVGHAGTADSEDGAFTVPGPGTARGPAGLHQPRRDPSECTALRFDLPTHPPDPSRCSRDCAPEVHSPRIVLMISSSVSRSFGSTTAGPHSELLLCLAIRVAYGMGAGTRSFDGDPAI